MKIHQWRKSFETGHAGIDGQHRKMIACLDSIKALIDERKAEEAFEECLKFRKFSDDHNEYEEKVLRDSGFPRQMDHQKSHQETIDKMDEVFSSCGEACKKSAATNCMEDMSMILVEHILRGDLDFKSFLETVNLADDNS